MASKLELVDTRARMVCAAAAELRDRDVVFVGIGLPSLACNLALRTHAPNLQMIYESGTIGTRPSAIRSPLAIPRSSPGPAWSHR
jgi:glutaconate CoA-transferase, subunit B